MGSLAPLPTTRTLRLRVFGVVVGAALAMPAEDPAIIPTAMATERADARAGLRYVATAERWEMA